MGFLIFFYYFYGLVLRQKQKNIMTKNSYYQVILIEIATNICCAIFAYFNFGNLANAIKCSGFLHITNPFINKNLYYEFNV
jgi:hypothetical protein